MSELGDNHSIDDLKLLWESDPSSKVYLELAEAYRKLGRHPEAVEVLEKSLEHRPRDPRGRVALARCLLETGDPGGAVELLEAVTRRDPEHIDAAKLFLEGCLQLGDFERASERLNIYRLLNDRDPEIDHLEYRVSLLESKGDAGSDQAASSSADSDEVSEEISEDGVSFDPDPGYASFARDLPEESSPYIPAPDMATLLAADTTPPPVSDPPENQANPAENQGVSFQYEADPDAEEAPEVEAPAVPEVSAPEVSSPAVLAPEVSVPDVTVPEVSAPEVTAPAVSVPDVTVPEVSVPEVSAPEIVEPEVSVPDMTVPEMSAPEGAEPAEIEPEPTPASEEPEPTPGRPSSAAMAAISAAAQKSAAKEEASQEGAAPEPEEGETRSDGPSEQALAAILAASKKAAEAPLKKDPTPPLADNELPAIEEATGLVSVADSANLFDLGAAPPKPSLDDLFDLRGPATPKPTLDALWGSPEPDESTESEVEEPVNEADAADTGAAAEMGEAATATLGELYLSQGHLDEAEEIFDRVLEQDPGNVAAREGKAKLESARAPEPVADTVTDGAEEEEPAVSGEPSSAAQAAIAAASRAAMEKPQEASPDDLGLDDLEVTEPMSVQSVADASDELTVDEPRVATDGATSAADSDLDFEINLVPGVDSTPEVEAVPEIDPVVPELDSVPEVDPVVPEIDPVVPEIDPVVPEIDPVPEIEAAAELSQLPEIQPEPSEIAPEPESLSSEEPAAVPSGEPSAAARAAIEAAARAQEAEQEAAAPEAPASDDSAAPEPEVAKRDLLTAGDLLADRSIKGVIPEGLTAKKILVLDQYAKHLRKTSQDHVH